MAERRHSAAASSSAAIPTDRASFGLFLSIFPP
jgi:hypothetical protein